MDDPTVLYPNAIQAVFSDLGMAIAKVILENQIKLIDCTLRMEQDESITTSN